MGVTSTNNRIAYAGNGVSTTFNFSYYFFALTDIVVFTYVAATGLVSQLVQGVDYTIAGTPNSQGLYPNGATVTATVAPPAGTAIVLVRIPPEVQNYSLIQNQTISANAVVQQFDYITLLIQRLQDLASRSMYLADGDNETFSPTLPSNLSLNPNTVLAVNNAGTGFTLLPQNIIITAFAPVIFGSKASPLAITAIGGVTFTGAAWVNTMYIQGSGNAVTVTKTVPISAPTNAGQRLRLVGCSDTNTVTLSNGASLSINGTAVLGLDGVLDLEADTNLLWVESGRNT